MSDSPSSSGTTLSIPARAESEQGSMTSSSASHEQEDMTPGTQVNMIDVLAGSDGSSSRLPTQSSSPGPSKQNAGQTPSSVGKQAPMSSIEKDNDATMPSSPPQTSRGQAASTSPFVADDEGEVSPVDDGSSLPKPSSPTKAAAANEGSTSEISEPDEGTSQSEDHEDEDEDSASSTNANDNPKKSDESAQHHDGKAHGKARGKTPKAGPEMHPAKVAQAALDHEKSDPQTEYIGLRRPQRALHVAGTLGGAEVPEGSRARTDYDTVTGPYSSWCLYAEYHEIDGKDKSTWPPPNVHLQDWHVYQLMTSSVPRSQLRSRWPSDFRATGGVRANRWPKGRAAKLLHHGQLHYVVVNGPYQLHGDEGHLTLTACRNTKDKNDEVKNKDTDKENFSAGQACLLQMDVEPTRAELMHGTRRNRYDEGKAPVMQTASASKKQASKKRKADPGTDKESLASKSTASTAPSQASEDPPSAKKPRTQSGGAKGKGKQANQTAKTTKKAATASGATSKEMSSLSFISADDLDLLAMSDSDGTASGESLLSLWANMGPLKVVDRKPPAKPDFTPFYRAELLNTVLQNADLMSALETILRSIGQAIYKGTQAETAEDAVATFKTVLKFIDKLNQGLQTRHHGTVQNILTRAEEHKISDMEALKKSMEDIASTAAKQDEMKDLKNLPALRQPRIDLKAGENDAK